MSHTYKDSPSARKKREAKASKKRKRANRSTIKQKIRHEIETIDEYDDDLYWSEYEDEYGYD